MAKALDNQDQTQSGERAIDRPQDRATHGNDA